MPLLNYTTKVDVYTTIGAIQGQLVRHGARKIPRVDTALCLARALGVSMDDLFGNEQTCK